MNQHGYEVVLAFVAATIVLTLLVGFVLGFARLFQRRQAQFRAEKQALHETYQREILTAQVETQNQTLQHVSGELHDHIGQLLAVAMLQLNVLDEDLVQTPHHPAVQQTGSLVQQVINDLRILSKTLNTDALTRIGLHDSIRLELDRIRRTGRYEAHLTITGEPRRLDPQVEIVLFRMVQEAISNTLKHARAKTILVSTNYQPDLFALSIADDGRGLPVTRQSDAKPAATGQGLGNLHRRAALLGGTCTIMSQPGEGCIITITLPSV
ncbi:MAG: histidine kinase [Rudanella sp.]|nr:histidine kinase [Rudanella sp.]